MAYGFPTASRILQFFVDHLHPTVAGHQEIGAAIALEIEKLGWFSPAPDAEARYRTLWSSSTSPVLAKSTMRVVDNDLKGSVDGLPAALESLFQPRPQVKP